MERPSRSNYYKQGYDKGDVKFRQRALVMRFMEKHLGEMQIPTFLTLPGESWLFELMVLQRWPNASFVGVEKSASTYARSRLHIPRNALAMYHKRDEVQDREFEYGRSSITYSRISNGQHDNGYSAVSARRRSNRLVLMDVNNYLMMIAEDHGATLAQKRAFVYKFIHKHAVWLDYTGPLTAKTLAGIGHLHMCLADTRFLKPVVITVLNGRDKYKSKEERVAAIKAAQPNLDVRRVWTYKGAGGCSMLTVCGVML